VYHKALIACIHGIAFEFKTEIVHNNFYFLKQLAPVLKQRLVGKFLIESFSQEKDELVMVWADRVEEEYENSFIIRAPFKQELSSLLFPERFERARRNSVNLFSSILYTQVYDVFVFENERAIGIALANGKTIVFKLFGNRANCILFTEEGKVEDVFQKRLKLDYALTLQTLHRPIDQSYEAFESSGFQWAPLFPTFGKLVKSVLSVRLESIESPIQQWQIIQDLVCELHAGRFHLVHFEYDLHLSLLPLSSNDPSYVDPIVALNAFYIELSKVNYLGKERVEAERLIDKLIKKTEAYLSQNYKRFDILLNGSRNEEIGHLLMANLHQIDTTQSEAKLYDFYNDTTIIVPLKKGVTPQKLAESYYRKAKNEQIEIKNIESNISGREAYLQTLKDHKSALQTIESVKTLREYLKVHGLLQNKVQIADPVDLFNTYSIQGYQVLVGRNAKNNDVLTKQYAKKEDLWLHARDVSGSHVVIRNQAGKKIPASVIERAAELAAWFSKRKTDSLCPVIVTPKKYVRKTKGLPDGAVIIDREQVVMVKPTPPEK
jgi:predicted ribosome quality control (RQC) complex YloA/Tae2 family protein